MLTRQMPTSKRDKVELFEKVIGQIPGHVEGDSDEFPLLHSFGDGIYIRELFIPAGSVVIGKLHKTAHPNFIMFGRCIVTSNNDDERVEITGPTYFVSPAGTKKIIYAIEDTSWINVHATDKTDINEIEDEVIAKDYTELPEDIRKELKWLS